jgi:DNA-binding beta-propeller fold protein YncE
LAVVALVLSAACTTAGREEQSAFPPATPAAAPPTTVSPAGTVWPVAPSAKGGVQGIAVDGGTGRVAVAVRDPNQLLLLDAGTGAVTRRIPLPARAAQVRLGPGGSVLVVAGKTLLRVPTVGDGAPISQKLPAEGQDVAPLPDDAALVSLPDQGRAVVVGPKKVPALRTGDHSAGVAANGELLGVVDSAQSTLTVFDTRGKLVQQTRAGDGATQLAVDKRGRFVVVDTRGGELLIFSTGPLFLRQRHPVSGSPYGTAYDSQRDILWVTLTARNELVGYNLSGGAPKEVGRFPTVRQPDSVAVDAGSGRVYIASRIDGIVQTITP